VADTHINRVKQAVSGTPGTGSITLAAALSGFRALGASQNGQTFPFLFLDGTAWEIATGCTYTHSGTTLSRGTLEDSSTGSRISLSSAAVCMVLPTAAFGNRFELGRVPTLAIVDESSSNDPGGPAVVYSSSTFRMMAWVVNKWKSFPMLFATNTWEGAQRGSITTLTPSGAITIDANSGNFYTLTPNANFGIANPTNLAAGQSFVIEITQPASGGPRVISSWGSYFRYAGGLSTLPALSTAANAVDVISCIAWTSTRIQILGIAKDIKA